jgi:ATP-dependent DNA ligase
MKTPRQGRRGFMLKMIAGAREAPFPTFIEPCKPTLRPKLSEGVKWIYEIKFDGYSAQLHKRGDNVKIYTSSGLDWSYKFATLCDAARDISATDLVLDGEIVAPNDRGVPTSMPGARRLGAILLGCCSTPSTCFTSMASTCAALFSSTAVAC